MTIRFNPCDLGLWNAPFLPFTALALPRIFRPRSLDAYRCTYGPGSRSGAYTESIQDIGNPGQCSGGNPPSAVANVDHTILFLDVFPVKLQSLSKVLKNDYLCYIREIPSEASKGSPVKISYEGMKGILFKKVLYRTKRFPMAGLSLLSCNFFAERGKCEFVVGETWAKPNIDLL